MNRLAVMAMKRTFVTVGLAVALGSLLGSCTPSPPAPNQPQPTAGQSTTSATIKNFGLYTHCGIHEFAYGDRWFTRDAGMLSDGSNNPPQGWDNPTQVGTLTIDGDSATFEDTKGHRETFTYNPNQTGPSFICY